MLSSNTIPELFDHQYFLEEAIYILDLWHTDCNQGKIACKATATDWVLTGMPTTIHKIMETSFYLLAQFSFTTMKRN